MEKLIIEGKPIDQLTAKEWRDMDRAKVNEIISSIDNVYERLKILQNTPSSSNPFKYWIQNTKREIIHRYMNALCTRSCLGHFKAAQNEQLIQKYLRWMEEFNIPVPSSDVSYILGTFNGKGSF